MQTIDASNNIISSLDEKAFAPVTKSIKHIRLNRNNINDIAPNTFAKLKSIEQIEMRNNQLEHLKKPALSIIFKRQEGKNITVTSRDMVVINSSPPALPRHDFDLYISFYRQHSSY